MGEETKQLRRLVIKAYHIREAMWGEENKVEESGVLTVDKESADRYKRGKEDYISDISFRIIRIIIICLTKTKLFIKVQPYTQILPEEEKQKLLSAIKNIPEPLYLLPAAYLFLC